MDDLRLSNSVRRMFWCNTGHQPSIETSHLDGSDRRVLAIDKVYRPQLLTVDLPVKRLYVLDTRMNSVQFCTYDGLRCHQVFAETQVILGFFFYYFPFLMFSSILQILCLIVRSKLGKQRRRAVQRSWPSYHTVTWLKTSACVHGLQRIHRGYSLRLCQKTSFLCFGVEYWFMPMSFSLLFPFSLLFVSMTLYK